MRDQFISRTITHYLYTVTVCDTVNMTMGTEQRMTLEQPTEKNFRSLYPVKDGSVIPVKLNGVEEVEHLYRMDLEQFVRLAEMVK